MPVALVSRLWRLALPVLVLGSACADPAPTAPDPLPSWRPGPVRDAIVGFVSAAAADTGAGRIPPAERIAVFDNDGTLWSEQPLYVQLAFALDRVRAEAASHPEWQAQEPFRSVLAGDPRAALAGGEAALLELVMATHAGMTTEAFEDTVRQWIATATHPATGRRYLDLVYQPMLELLQYLRGHGFKTYIVSGGGIEFMRPWVEARYGIPPEQVIGSSVALAFAMQDSVPVLVRQPKIDFIDDKAGKPVGIQKFIGRRPVFAFGNSDGDLQMLQWAAAGAGPRFLGLVHHTDADREFAYDRDSPVGRLDAALAEAGRRGWTVVDMRRDWTEVFPPQAP
jgi:phosphoglycolate phosphatase-like HAD superfamily hydrolase